MRIAVFAMAIALLAGCYPQAARFEKDYDWEDRQARIAILPTDNHAFDTRLEDTFVRMGYAHTFIAAIPPYGNDLYPDFATADLIVETSRNVYARGPHLWIRGATLAISRTRSPQRSGSVARHGRTVYENSFDGEVPYQAEDMGGLIQTLLDPLSRYLIKE